MTTTKAMNWVEAKGQYRINGLINLHPDMLTEAGLSIPLSKKIKGEEVKQLVTFDRRYVHHRFTEYFNQLNLNDEEIGILIKEIKSYRNRIKNEERNKLINELKATLTEDEIKKLTE
jgi:N-acetyl-anhydromuramyl-L-alanine amidase AmpD